MGRSLTGSWLVGHDAEQQDGQHHQGRHDRPADEEFGDVHGRIGVRAG
ncbi:MAG: hypothetical protein MZU95_02685 [Desulfomicrobium escambiense]|nr:hypothetical protein [Desulfomicrobium escambiense]